MIETKYGLKYHFPHSMIHIIDNSMYKGELPVVEAVDPSLYATMVVSAMPYGEDGVFHNITRSDVLNVAWGNGMITASDIKKYGQQITYPASLINQNAPVRMLRVTPEGSTYAFSCIVAQWYVEDKDGVKNLNIRFLVRDGKSEEISNISNIERYKNTDRLYNKLCDIYNVTTATVSDEKGFISYDANSFPCTNQALLICNIGAGRGRNYNVIANTISQANQGKNPANVLYTFTSYDTTTDLETERFSAPLVDINNTRVDKTPSVNEQIGGRVKGTSLTKQYVNEACVAGVYTAWRNILAEVINSGGTVVSESEKDYIRQVYNATNVNTFDVLFGKFIATGSEDLVLPRYEIIMVNPDIPMLDESYRILVKEASATTPDVASAKLSEKLNGTPGEDFVDTSLVGIKAGESVNIGDIYFTGNVANLVTGINQYSGGITSIAINLFRKYTASNTPIVDADVTKKVAPISGIYSATSPMAAAGVPSAVAGKEDIIYGIYDPSNNNAVTLYYKKTTAAEVYAYKPMDLYKSLVLNSNGKTNSNAYANIIGIKAPEGADYTTETSTYGAYVKVGGTWIDLTGDDDEPVINVNGNKFVAPTGGAARVDDNIVVKSNKQVYSRIPSSVDVVTNIIGSEYDVILEGSNDAKSIYRFMITGTQGSVFSFAKENKNIPSDYYDQTSDGEYLYSSAGYLAENGGVKLNGGSTGFFDEYDDGIISTEVFKWLYAKLLVSAYRGQIDARITSPNRVNAKYLFDGGHNTLIGITILPYMTYTLSDVAQASTMYTEDEKTAIQLDPTILEDPRISPSDDIDVKTAMYDLMIERVYQRIPENKRPEGPGYGLSLHLDAGICDAQTALLMNSAFSKKFTNANASWDIGGFTQGNITYTWTKRIVDNLFNHMTTYSVNKPYAGSYTAFTDYQSFFPDVDTTDWEYRELLYNTGGNVWIPDQNGVITRRSQRTLNNESTGTSDLIQESNMRTLTQFCDILQRKIDNNLLEYDDDGVIKTLEDNCNVTFSPWVGNLVKDLNINFARDINIDGGDILICKVRLVFRGLVLRVPILVNVERRSD